MLQWVHGPRTVVMGRKVRTVHLFGALVSFNGSTVREPWLCPAEDVLAAVRYLCFNGSTVREPWLWAKVREAKATSIVNV